MEGAAAAAAATSEPAAADSEPAAAPSARPDAEPEPAGALRGPCRRLAFAKLLHARLSDTAAAPAGAGTALGDLLTTDVASLVAESMRVTYWTEQSCDGEETQSYSGQDACGIGWGSTRTYCQSGALTGEVSKLRVTCEGSDQGWGNTGHSRIEVALIRGDSDGDGDGDGEEGLETVRHYPLSTVNHDRAEYTLECCWAAGEGEEAGQDSAAIPMPRSLCTEARKGDRFAVVMVSAPYPGFACKCYSATIEAEVYC